MPANSLKTEISAFISKYSYFNTKFLKKELSKNISSFKAISVNQYLYSLKKQTLVYDAGLSWYSKIPNHFILDTTSLKTLKDDLNSAFPFLEFNVWSVTQLKNYFHHLYTQDVSFIYTDFESLNSLYDHLKDKNFNVYNNPDKRILSSHFNIKENTIILRPSISEEPSENNFSAIEKILIDLFIESNRLNLFDRTEYKRIFYNIICSSRINISGMLRYSKRREIRKTFVDKVIQSESYINCR
ncbi:MAG: DUF6577 family protein [Ignavibacteriaceae bacterium]